MSKKADSFYSNLKIKLNEIHNWPTKYVFKFIVLNHRDKIDELNHEFLDLNSKIIKNYSSKKKYVSFTFIVKLDSANDVIKKYKEVSKIDGIISL